MPTLNTLCAKDLMVTKLIVFRDRTDVFDAIDVMLKNKISGAPVVDLRGKYVGIFSERCCIDLLFSATYDGTPTNTISAFIDREAVTIDENTELLSVMQIFMKTRARRLPVLNDQGDLLGMVSRRDVIKALSQKLTHEEQQDSGVLYISSTRSRESVTFV